MLVCNVSLRPPRSAIAASISEVTAAVDAIASGNIVFATLIDDPASVADHVDSFLGEILAEAGSATDAVSAASTYAAAIVENITVTDQLLAELVRATIAESATASDVVSALGIFAASVSETATATDTPDAATSLVEKDAMVPGVYINSSGTTRDANANGIMVNLR